MDRKIPLIKKGLNILFFILVGVIGIIFTILYVDTFNYEFLIKNSVAVNGITVFIFSLLTILAIIFFNNDKEFVYKLFLCIIVLITICVVSLFFIKKTGFFDRIRSVNDFREYISSFGSWTVFVFIACQFLQVVALPIPSFITIGAGVLLFGPFLGATFSCIGIILGSIVAFFIGRFFGYNIVKWLIGEKALNKALISIEGKDKVVLTFMFLFPFFPDDVLCFVAGITKMSSAFFVGMIIVVRIVCIFLSSYSLNNSLIPYDTWWGIMLWVLFLAITITLAIVLYKKTGKNKVKTKSCKTRK